MSESDSFISEVSEEVRRERLYGYLRRYGWLILLVLVVIIGGAAFNEWRKARDAGRAEAAGDALRAAMLVADPADRAAALATVVTQGDGSTVARLAQAGALRVAGQSAEAAAVLSGIAEDGSVPELYRSLAALQRIMLLGSSLDADERDATLVRLSADDAPFRLLALEQHALLHFEESNNAAVLEDLGVILADPDATEAMRARARQLIAAAGGSLSPEGGMVAPDAASGSLPVAPADG